MHAERRETAKPREGTIVANARGIVDGSEDHAMLEFLAKLLMLVIFLAWLVRHWRNERQSPGARGHAPMSPAAAVPATRVPQHRPH
jgi:hypothetical protein